MHWLSETVIVDQRPSYRFRIVGNRYIPRHAPDPADLRKSDCHVSLVFLHANGLFKETFEPVIDYLFKDSILLRSRSGESLVIDEAWSIECPNHGQSATLNADDIRRECGTNWPFREYSEAVHTFLRAKPGGYDISGTNFVLIGHSFGAASIPFIAQIEPKIKIRTVILGDPIASPPSHATNEVGNLFLNLALARQDVWASRDQARKFFKSDALTKDWPIESLELLLKYGLVDHPARALLKPLSFNGVTLACVREHEALVYRYLSQYTEGYSLLATLYASETPVHLLYTTKSTPM
ncbi:hypothetical protein SISSUDRAFT_742783 [Sistotremastrum suecicum HHB10207 ss-3]|uniref:AB hydrolase-1 domain-containing protein n=1 Tax=Sistotremastrum suecicum HHB10207 ss-3 TaxID=1314776 RepID=A0A166HWG7_9AGAM|nr:hypothetical protein SISSUDRAFT_742783 [Sistotremastrum suecicum HHB10207 ss-3]